MNLNMFIDVLSYMIFSTSCRIMSLVPIFAVTATFVSVIYKMFYVDVVMIYLHIKFRITICKTYHH
jgi:type IV secretory pathway VirB3-like protein